MSKERSLVKEFHSLMKNIESFSNGEATVSSWDDDNLDTFQVTLAPSDGCYKDGEFIFEIVRDPARLSDAPRVYCKTAIYHPNIDTMADPDGEICLNLFDDDMWTEDLGLEDVIQGLLFLLYNPNLDDPLCCEVNSNDMEEFEQQVKTSIAGGRVGKFLFPVNPRYARLHPKEEEKVKDNAKEEVKEKKEDGKSEEQAGDGQGEDKADGQSEEQVDGQKEDKEDGQGKDIEREEESQREEKVDVEKECCKEEEGVGKDIEEEGENHTKGENEREEAYIKKDEVKGCVKEEDSQNKEEDQKEEGNDGQKEDGLKDEVKEGGSEEKAENGSTDEPEEEKKEERFVERFFGIRRLVSDSFDDDEEDVIDDMNEEEEEEEEDDEDDDDVCSSNGNDGIDKVNIDDDNDVVNDEDLEELLNTLDSVNGNDDLVDDENRKNLDGFESIVSWSKMVYGAQNRTQNCTPHPVLIQEQPLGPESSTSTSQGACKEPGLSSNTFRTRPGTERRPTVASRFYLALKTRNFRRWLV